MSNLAPLMADRDCTGPDNGATRFAVARYQTAGNLDSSFSDRVIIA
jgi:hypothetical protein